MIQRTQRGLNRRLKKLPFLKGWYEQRQFRVERDLINGRTHKVVDHPSILHFSVNKAATQYTKRIMLRCAQENGLLPVQLSAYAWKHDFPYLFTQTAEENLPYIHVFRPKGYVYTVFGGLVKGIPDIEQYLTIIMVRDPRDILVSEYYSYSKSHRIPPDEKKAEEFVGFRQYVQALTIDEYVMDSAQELRDRLQEYVDLSKQYDSVFLLKYEDMIADFSTWLDTLLVHSQLKISDSLRMTLIDEARRSRQKKKEDATRHRRQVTPGDHLRKLQPETIAYLNEMFADVMHRLQYSLNSETVNES